MTTTVRDRGTGDYDYWHPSYYTLLTSELIVREHSYVERSRVFNLSKYLHRQHNP